MTKTEVGALVEELICIRDMHKGIDLSRRELDILADACNTLSHNKDRIAEDGALAKKTKRLEELVELFRDEALEGTDPEYASELAERIGLTESEAEWLGIELAVPKEEPEIE